MVNTRLKDIRLILAPMLPKSLPTQSTAMLLANKERPNKLKWLQIHRIETLKWYITRKLDLKYRFQ